MIPCYLSSLTQTLALRKISKELEIWIKNLKSGNIFLEIFQVDTWKLQGQHVTQKLSMIYGQCCITRNLFLDEMTHDDDTCLVVGPIASLQGLISTVNVPFNQWCPFIQRFFEKECEYPPQSPRCYDIVEDQLSTSSLRDSKK